MGSRSKRKPITYIVHLDARKLKDGHIRPATNIEIDARSPGSAMYRALKTLKETVPCRDNRRGPGYFIGVTVEPKNGWNCGVSYF